jgi:hypothetical protein
MNQLTISNERSVSIDVREFQEKAREYVEASRSSRDGKEHTFFIFLNPNNPKLESQGLKNVCRKFSKGIK